jgi:syntaxin 7
VLRQLESKLKEQIVGQRNRLKNTSDTSTQKQALMKLERDFERVQNAVIATKSKVARQMKQYQQRGNASGVGDNLSTTIGHDSGNDNTSARMLQTQQQLIQQQLEQDRLNEEIMREREEEIRKINRGMHTVNEIYKDLAHIVGQQQDDVDKIETQMEDARDTAQSGLDQVHQANEKYGSQQCSIM